MLGGWTCHICGRERPDDKIDVLTYPAKGLVSGEYNVRYCNDNPSCFAKALTWKRKGEFPHK